MIVTMTDLCDVMNNWFDTKADGTKDRHFGTFKIENNSIDLSETGIKAGQYYRIVGSTFNDGVWQYPYPQTDEPTTEPVTDEAPTETDIPDVSDGTDGTDNTDNTEDTETNTDENQNTGETQATEEEEPEPEEDKLVDEEFEGAIWIMYVPPQVTKLLGEINAWEEVYGPIVASPFNSETFGGYSYYKGYKNTMSNVTSSWSSKFAEQINKWRKVRRLV